MKQCRNHKRHYVPRSDLGEILCNRISRLYSLALPLVSDNYISSILGRLKFSFCLANDHDRGVGVFCIPSHYTSSSPLHIDNSNGILLLIPTTLPIRWLITVGRLWPKRFKMVALEA